MDYLGKKLLILGGASVHIKLVRTAQMMGCYVIVTDNVEDSPGKAIADESWELNIYEVDKIVDRAKKAHVDGVISAWLDPCQKPYQQICTKLQCYCYGSEEQFFKMTNKHAFKRMCIENNVDVIPEFSERDIKEKIVEFPVFVKPVDSRGSRGQSVCYSYNDLKDAVTYAKDNSSDGTIIIEKYLKSCPEIQVTYFFVDGTPYLIRTTDSYTGSEKNRLEKVVMCSISPSKYTNNYLETAHESVIKMFLRLGIKNGPVFMQGFKDGNKYRFFDPGLRFPGVDYELIFKKVFNIDFTEVLIKFALSGRIDNIKIQNDSVFLKGKIAAVFFPVIKAGIVQDVSCLSELHKNENVISCLPRVKNGQKIDWTFNVNQRLAEIDILGNNILDIRDNVEKVQNALIIQDEKQCNMIFEKFDVGRIEG